MAFRREPMTSWRLVKAPLAATAFDGEGARLHGGRWSSPGVRVIYAAEHLSLAALEMLVHLQDAVALRSYVAIDVEFDADLATEVDRSTLPVSWRAYPVRPELQVIGNEWAATGRSVILRVPSAIVPVESNFLFNPAHPQFESVKIGRPRSFDFDVRLLRSAGPPDHPSV